MDEVWIDIEEFKGYYKVSNYGRVLSLERKIISCNGNSYTKKQRILQGFVNEYGYRTVFLCVNKHRKTFLVHRLVAIMFIPRIKNKPHINHLDQNRLNNSIDNLEWVNRRENVSHAKLRLKTRSSKYIGVSFHKKIGKYSAHITISKKYINLGFFDSEEKAHTAYMVALEKYDLVNKYAYMTSKQIK